jgi:hypothetical protein
MIVGGGAQVCKLFARGDVCACRAYIYVYTNNSCVIQTVMGPALQDTSVTGCAATSAQLPVHTSSGAMY